jgi:hypothetical protein
MFGNRKRKPQEEESVVPHGLIWHATAEPTPEENAKNNEESLSHTVLYAQGIEQARRPQSAREAAPGPQAVPQAPIPAPAPLPWWRLQQTEPETVQPPIKPTLLPLSEYGPTPVKPNEPPRRVPQVQLSPAQLPAVSLPPVPSPLTVEARAARILQVPVPQAPVARVPVTKVQAPQHATPQVHKPQATPLTTKRPTVDAMLRSVEWLRTFGQWAWRNTLIAGSKARRSWLQISQSLELREAVLSAGKHGQHLLQGVFARTSRYAQSCGRAVAALSHGGMARLQRMSAKVNSVSPAATTDVLRPANTQPSAASRVSVLLAASASRAKAITARQLSQWRMKRERVAIDSRFWTSMTLAAISASIVLGIVSVVPNYAAKSLPSRILSPSSSVNASVAAPGVLAAPRQTSSSQAVPPQTGKTAAKRTANPKLAQEKPASPEAAVPRKPHRAADDDYVAPDTYKYYGNGSKHSR